MSRRLLSLPVVLLVCLVFMLAGCEKPDQPLVESDVPRGNTEVLDPVAEPSDLAAPEAEDADAIEATVDPLPTEDDSDAQEDPPIE